MLVFGTDCAIVINIVEILYTKRSSENIKAKEQNYQKIIFIAMPTLRWILLMRRHRMNTSLFGCVYFSEDI